MNPWPVDAEVAEVHLPRPGHADLAGVQKYGFTDVRNVLERASARETAARVACGALAKAFLREFGVEVLSHVTQIGSSVAPARDDLGLETSRGSTSRRCAAWTPTPRGDGRGDQRPAQGQRVAGRHLRGDRLRAGAGARLAHLLGGAPGRPPGQAIMSIQAMKGAGSARASTSRAAGSEARRDLLGRARLHRETNRAGARGRHDHRRAAGRARGDEAAAHADQAAALGRHRHQRARPGAARAHRLLHRARRRRGGRGDGRARAGPPTGTSSAGRHRRRPRRRARLPGRIGWRR